MHLKIRKFGFVARLETRFLKRKVIPRVSLKKIEINIREKKKVFAQKQQQQKQQKKEVIMTLI